MNADVRRALTGSWLLLSFVAGASLLAPFVVSAGTLFSLFPPCPSKLAGSECIACGLTTGFIALADGDWRAAQEANSASVPLAAFFALNFAAAVTYVVLKARRRSR
jgi:hypothetical protein